jgi:hypothetical protein
MDLKPFAHRRLWEMALLEGIGTGLLVWSSALLGRTLVPLAAVFASGPLWIICVAAVIQFFSITLFTFTLGPVTGGRLPLHNMNAELHIDPFTAHLNPLITMATFSVRLASFPRTVLYIVFQCVSRTVHNASKSS